MPKIFLLANGLAFSIRPILISANVYEKLYNIEATCQQRRSEPRVIPIKIKENEENYVEFYKFKKTARLCLAALFLFSINIQVFLFGSLTLAPNRSDRAKMI